MVNQKVNIRDKKRGLKKFLKFFIILFVLVIIGFAVYYTVGGVFFGKGGQKIVLENPLKDIVLKYSVGGEVQSGDVDKIIEEAILDFDENYINYILLALGVNKLHKSPLLENPKIEIDVGEVWSSEIVKGSPQTFEGEIDSEDVRFVMSKEEAIMALLSEDIGVFMTSSVSNGGTQIEMIANKVELFSKGYLGLYTDLTGEELEIEE